MESSLHLAAYIFNALAFGGMTFFLIITAPMVFIHLDQGNAGKLIRAIFPWYYLFVIVTAGISGFTVLTLSPYAAGCLCIAVLSAIMSRQWLMPRINHARDQSQAGDANAGKKFERLHKISVRMNAVSLAGVFIAIILLALYT